MRHAGRCLHYGIETAEPFPHPGKSESAETHVDDAGPKCGDLLERVAETRYRIAAISLAEHVATAHELRELLALGCCCYVEHRNALAITGVAFVRRQIGMLLAHDLEY